MMCQTSLNTLSLVISDNTSRKVYHPQLTAEETKLRKFEIICSKACRILIINPPTNKAGIEAQVCLRLKIRFLPSLCDGNFVKSSFLLRDGLETKRMQILKRIPK
jgi:hypothetical protein